MTRDPWWKPASVAATAVAWVLEYRGAPTVFDEWLALPIAIETADKGTYSVHDILVAGSVAGPFHLYKAASVFYRLHWDVDVVWYVLLVLSLLALMLSVWRLGRALGLSDAERTVLVFAVAASPMYRGTLNWSAQPMLSFISASIATPLGLFAVAAALEGASIAAFTAAAVAFNIHPSIGLCSALATVTCLLPARPWRTLIRGGAVGLVIALPNVVYLLMHSASASPASREQLLGIVRSFGYHTFISDHWRDGYAWYALLVASAFVGASRLSPAKGAAAKRVIAVLSVTAAAWIVVMNTVPQMTLWPFLLIRGSLLVKPLALGLTVVALTRGVRPEAAIPASVMAVAALAHPNPVVGEAALAGMLAVLLASSSRRGVRPLALVLAVCASALLLAVAATHVTMSSGLALATSSLRVTTLVAGACAAVALYARDEIVAGADRPASAIPARRLVLAGFALLPLSAMLAGRPWRAWLPQDLAQIEARMRLSQPGAREAGAMRWARDHAPRGSLFAVPPTDVNWLRFRVAARQGIYITVFDVSQLTYMPPYAVEAVGRLERLGVAVRASHVFDATRYLHPTCAQLRALAADGVTHYVLPAANSDLRGATPVYHDTSYAVLSMAQAVPSLCDANGGAPESR
ncbi:MAG: hypothetical protein ACYC7F_00640 [Gemmatimonadaceae bacterium]